MRKKKIGINRRRSEIEILTEILKMATMDIKKTALLYKANLNHSLLNKYLNFMIEKKLLVRDNDLYSITEKGYEFLVLSRKLQRLLEEDRVHF